MKTGNSLLKGFSLFSFGGCWLADDVDDAVGCCIRCCCVWNISFSKDFFFVLIVDGSGIIATFYELQLELPVVGRFYDSKEIIKFSASLRI